MVLLQRKLVSREIIRRFTRELLLMAVVFAHGVGVVHTGMSSHV